MKHIVNFGLLFSFFTLAVTGVMSYALPFSLPTARIHIVFGLVTCILVLMHLGSRIPYFKSAPRPKGTGKALVPWYTVTAIAAVFAALLWISFEGWSPAKELTAQSYEARQRVNIVRASPLSGFIEDDLGNKIVARLPEGDATLAIALLIKLKPSEGEAPAVAVWAETKTGTMIETLYIDPRLAYTKTPEWGGKQTPRHEILPIWRHKYTLLTGIDPSGDIDAQSATTANHTFSINDYLDLGSDNAFNLCIEINAAKDPNKTYTDPHLGQPSVYYAIRIKVDDAKKYYLMEPVGHGAEAAKSGTVRYDLDKLTTALDLLELGLVKIEPYKKNQRSK